MAENPPTVLVIDDDTPMRRFLRATLTANGYQLLEVTTAQEGLVQAATRQPEVVILDLGLPRP
jgi:two-component system, OmpR family, KDP operon response regulator KdpE